MDAHPYFGGGNAVVDTCERCGLVWLDAGELAIIERYVPHVHQIERTLRLPGATSDRFEEDWLFLS
jgi:Zn-finger nucleic acid-binding protein